MKRYLERDFLSKMVIYNEKEVSGYLNRPAHIYEEATCKGMWVIVREDRKYKWNYVTRLFKPTLDHKLMQLTASGVANFGNIILPGLIGAEQVLVVVAGQCDAGELTAQGCRAVNRHDPCDGPAVLGDLHLLAGRHIVEYAQQGRLQHRCGHPCGHLTIIPVRSVRRATLVPRQEGP